MSRLKSESILWVKLPIILLLSLMYVFLGYFSKELLISPFPNSNYLLHVELVIPVITTVVLGGFVGGSISAIGFLSLETFLRLIDEVTTPLDVLLGIQAISYFIVFVIMSRFTTEFKEYMISWKWLINITMWIEIIINTLASILSVAIIYPVVFSVFSLLSPSSTGFDITSVLNAFLIHFTICITIVPISLMVYRIIDVLRFRREEHLDRKHQELTVNSKQDGPGKLEKVFFDKHAFRVGMWTPIHLKFEHTWKAPRSYEIEVISTSSIYPHLDHTPVLQPNQSWTHIIYVLPLKQEHVNLQFRLLPTTKKSFKQPIKHQTTGEISGVTYIKRDKLITTVIILAELIAFIFIFSFLWSQVLAIVADVFQDQQIVAGSTLTIPWSSLITLLLVESLFFIPYLLITYLLFYRKSTTPISDLSFSKDISTHQYKEKKRDNPSRLVIAIGVGLVLVLGTSMTFCFILLWQVWINDIPSFGISTFSTTETVGLVIASAIIMSALLILLRNAYSVILARQSTKLGEGKFLLSVQASGQFHTFKPNLLEIQVKNVGNLPGVRLVLNSNDPILPSSIELHLDPDETATVRIGLTPLSRGKQDILVLVYPLFNKQGDYIPLAETTPLGYQNIQYYVLGETYLGITRGQIITLRHLIGWGSLLASSISFANSYIGIQDVITQWRDTIPWFLAMQIPFVYIYYLFSNRFIQHVRTY